MRLPVTETILLHLTDTESQTDRDTHRHIYTRTDTDTETEIQANNYEKQPLLNVTYPTGDCNHKHACPIEAVGFL